MFKLKFGIFDKIIHHLIKKIIWDWLRPPLQKGAPNLEPNDDSKIVLYLPSPKSTISSSSSSPSMYCIQVSKTVYKPQEQ